MDKASLIGDRTVETSTVEIPGHGAATVRKLSRAEYLRAGRVGGDDPVQFERVVIAAATLDPELGEHDVAAWQKQPGSSAEIAPLLDGIMVFSGFRQDAAKSGV
jgi:hypothetical protein